MARNRDRNKKYPGCWLENGILYCRYRHPVTDKDCTAKYGKKNHDRTWAKCYKYKLQLIDGDIQSNKEIRDEERKAEGLTIKRMAEKYFNHFDTDSGLLNREKSIYHTDKLTLPKHLMNHFGSKDITGITKADIRKFREYCDTATQHSGSRYSDQSKKHFMGFLQRILNYNDILFSSVFWKSVTPKVVNTRAKKGYLTTGEMANLRAVLDTYQYNPPVVRMMRLFMTWGCRCSELTRLRWENVDMKSRTVRFVDRKNGAKDLVLAMDDEVSQVFKEQRGRVIPLPNTLVFPSESGGIRITQAISRACRKILDKAGIDKSFKPTHGFRDNTAFYVHKSAGLETASKTLGHTSTRTTEGYIETIEDGHIEAINIMSALKKG